MTGFEMFMFGSVALMFAAIFVLGIVYITKDIICLEKKNDVKSVRNVENDNTQNVENTTQRVLCKHNNSHIYNNGTDNLYDSSMGNIHGQESSGRNIQTTRCYENGEITNLCTIIALKNVKREMQTMLTPIEIDALSKAVDNTITVEKLKAFIDNVELEDIDIDE